MTTPTFGPVPPDRRDDDTLRRIARLPSLAFGFPVDETLPWYRDEVGVDNLRVLSRPDPASPAGPPEVLGALGRVPMGLFVCGREVPQLGVLGVAVPPEHRGSGVATRLMHDALNAMHDEGVPLSTLYSAMHPLYRRCGYEYAGVLCDATVPASLFPGDLPLADAANRWHEATGDDLDAIKACYRRYASGINGMLGRPDYIWNRIRSRQGEATPFVRRDAAGEVDAYCFVVQKKWNSRDGATGSAVGAEMLVTDCAWTSPDGLAALCRLLRGYTSMVGEITLSLPPTSPLLTALPDWRYTLRVRTAWLLRVVNVKAAIESRGYLPGVSGEVTLDITDDTIEANNGPWTLAVDKTRATVARAGRAGNDPIRLHVRDLAPLLTGHTTPRALRDAGRAACSDEAADLAASLLATPGIPAMVDMF